MRKAEATVQKKKEKVKKIIPLLKKMHPTARCELEHDNPLELLVATILSAQCTDVRVNQVTNELFKKYLLLRNKMMKLLYNHIFNVREDHSR